MAVLALNFQLRRRYLRGSERWRLAFALCVSVFAHYCLVAIGPGGSAVRPAAQPLPSGISARLVATPSRDSEATARDDAAQERVAARDDNAIAALPAVQQRPPAEKPIAGRERSPAVSAEKSISISRPASLPAVADTTWYSAQDIDAYPQSAVPLRLAPPPGSSLARLLLWLRIDEHGEVVEVSAGEPGIPESLVDAARASLTAIRFTPARKDERAVRSRLLISVSVAHGP